MARIEPKMLCLVKKDGETIGMVTTIRKSVASDPMLPNADLTSPIWLCETLGSMQAQRLLVSKEKSILLGNMTAPPGVEGWVSECYLYPLPGLPAEDEEVTKEKEREHESAV